MSEIVLDDAVTQDGGQFYDEHGLIADYSDLVQGDWDIEGAELARVRFADQWPELAYRKTWDNEPGTQSWAEVQGDNF